MNIKGRKMTSKRWHIKLIELITAFAKIRINTRLKLNHGKFF